MHRDGAIRGVRVKGGVGECAGGRVIVGARSSDCACSEIGAGEWCVRWVDRIDKNGFFLTVVWAVDLLS